jgi:ubiquinone/menaquinone biosynthesis C-methylase UbiE
MGTKDYPSFYKARLKSLLAEPWLIPDKVLVYVLNIISFDITRHSTCFGWLQAVLWSPFLDRYQRYAAVAEEIRKLDRRNLSILDVGGGGDMIRAFINLKENDVSVLDMNVDSLRRVKSRRVKLIIGDGSALPFKEDSFDVVVSVDSLEHAPDIKKFDYCHELKRVARNYVVVHCPVDSADGRFQSTPYDVKFLQWHQQRFGRDEPNTIEHLKSGLPRMEQLAAAFPNAKLIGRQNCDTWFTYMKREYTPYARFMVGWLYKFSLWKRDSEPPYKSCLLVWKKK